MAHSATRLLTCTHVCEPQTGGTETVLCQAFSCDESARLNLQGAKAPASIALAIFDTRKVPLDDEVACPIECTGNQILTQDRFSSFLIDIDECNIPGVKCTQDCENSIPGYECKCFPGYKLEDDDFTCTGITLFINTIIRVLWILDLILLYSFLVDINECLDQNSYSCPGKFRVCENIPGNYTCKCQDGLYFINGTCQGEIKHSNGINYDYSPYPCERIRFLGYWYLRKMFSYAGYDMFKEMWGHRIEENS